MGVLGAKGRVREDLFGTEYLEAWKAQREADVAEEREEKLEEARRGLRELVVKQGWAPDVGAVVSRHKGMALRGTEAKLLTVAKTTIAQYRKVGRILLRRCVTELVGEQLERLAISDIPIKPAQFAEWLARKKPSIAGATWGAYKQYGLAMLEVWPDMSASDEEVGKAFVWLRSQTAEGARGYRIPKNERHGDAGNPTRRRVKQIPLDDLEAILGVIAKKGGKGGKLPSDKKKAWILGDWLIAALATGLRPVEWRQTRLVLSAKDVEIWPPLPTSPRPQNDTVPSEDAFVVVPPEWRPRQGSVQLIVHSTKHSNNRGNRPVRTLDVTDFPFEVLQSVARMVWRGAGDPEVWAKTQYACGRLLNEIQQELWPRRRTTITFYSARHQAMANWKASIGTFAAAVLAGHGIPDGPERYYAARANSWQRRKDDKAGGGGPSPNSRVAALAKVSAPGRAKVEEKSLEKKAGELGMARLAKPNPHAAKPAPEQSQKQAPAPQPASDTLDFDF
jgi:hypothetical protein